MKVNYQASTIQINYLGPLIKWRILEVGTLLKMSNYESTLNAFCKALRNLEKKRLVESFQNPFTKKKYLYLTNYGFTYFAGVDNPPSIIKETLVHDSKVVELVLCFLRLETFYGFELEHNLKDSNTFRNTYRLLPDALLLGNRKESKIRIALELELTRKTKAKYLSKIGQYLSSDYYDYIIYFFQTESILNSYKTHVEEKYGKSSNEKIIYVLNDMLLGNSFSFDRSIAFFLGESGEVTKLFD